MYYIIILLGNLLRINTDQQVVTGPDFYSLSFLWPLTDTVYIRGNNTSQCSPLSLVQGQQCFALIGPELHSISTPALICHKEPVHGTQSPLLKDEMT